MTPPEPRGGEGLKPCPFDGEPAVARDAMGEHWIACEHCDATSRMTSSLADAIAAWNRRPSSPPSGGGGWPSREAVEEAIYKAFGLGQENDAAEDAVSRILALFPLAANEMVRDQTDGVGG